MGGTLSGVEKKKVIAEHVRGIMETLGLDLKDDSLKDTPDRVAKMYVDELFCGLNEENFPKMTRVSNSGIQYGQMLVEREIRVQSVCEHHLVPIVGVAHVGYVPKENVIGLSKINRIVDFYSRRPQVQERLTEQIHKCLVDELETEDIAVIIDAKHFCVSMRGIRDTNSSTITSKLSGSFSDVAVRKEFLDLIKLKNGN